MAKLFLDDPYVNALVGEKASPSMSKPVDMNPFGDSGFYPVPGRELPEITVVEPLPFVANEQPTDPEGRALLEVLAKMNECLLIAAHDTTFITLALDDCYAAALEVDVTDPQACDFITAELAPQGEEEHCFIPDSGEALLLEGP